MIYIRRIPWSQSGLILFRVESGQRRIPWQRMMTKSCFETSQSLELKMIKVTHRDGDSEQHQVVIPLEDIPGMLKHLHNYIGYPGRDKTTSLVIDRFYWPRMMRDIVSWIEECYRCLKFKTSDNQRAELVRIKTYPFELACMAYVTLEPFEGGIQNILAITDHFSKFSVVVPTRN